MSRFKENFFARVIVSSIFAGNLKTIPIEFFLPKSCQGKLCANQSKFSRQKS